ncbi:hypothetical protein C6P42_003971 [Pichia californica]|nr:hypothetical protein C6P42_003971 [[Candida] californica]
MQSNSTDKLSTSRKLQRLKSQLYISDNSDIENIIDDPNLNNSSNITNTNNTNDPNLIPLTLPNGNNDNILSSSLPSRHTRKRERIDYNENKRIPLYITTTASPSSIRNHSSSSSKNKRKRKKPIDSNSISENKYKSNNLNYDITESNDSINTTSIGTINNTELNNDFKIDQKIDTQSILSDIISDINPKFEKIDSDIIDISFLKRIVETDLNKKLSVLSDSDILVSTNPISELNRKGNIHQKRRINELNDIEYNLNDYSQDNDHDNSVILEDETQNHRDSTFPSQININSNSNNNNHNYIEEFTDKINDEIKNKYEMLSSSIINDKQRQINSTINSIDKEINLLKSKYSNYKHHIENLEKKNGLTRNLSSVIKPINFKPTFYPQIFEKQFEETQNKIQIESNLLTYSLIKNNFNKDINTETIIRRHISSFNENRESMKHFLRNKIKELDDSVQNKVGGTELVALANASTMMDWQQTNKLVEEAQLKLLQSKDLKKRIKSKRVKDENYSKHKKHKHKQKHKHKSKHEHQHEHEHEHKHNK